MAWEFPFGIHWNETSGLESHKNPNIPGDIQSPSSAKHFSRLGRTMTCGFDGSRTFSCRFQPGAAHCFPGPAAVFCKFADDDGLVRSQRMGLEGHQLTLWSILKM